MEAGVPRGPTRQNSQVPVYGHGVARYRPAPTSTSAAPCQPTYGLSRLRAAGLRDAANQQSWVEQFGVTRSYRALRNVIRRFYRDHYPLTEGARACI